MKEEEEEEEEEEVTLEGQRNDRLALAPGPAREPAPGPHASLGAAPAPAPHHDDTPPEGAGASEITLGEVKEEEETLGQLRDRQALALAHGPVWVDCHIKVEDSTAYRSEKCSR